MRNSRTIRILVIVFFSFVMFACSDGGNDSPPPSDPNTVEPTLTSLWDNLFSGCGINCHSATASDGTENGPDLSTKANFYSNLVNKSPSDIEYQAWVRNSDCNVNFITPGDVNQSSLAAVLIQSISDSFGCTTSYNIHEVNNQTISDDELKNALITWINSGAQNN